MGYLLAHFSVVLVQPSLHGLLLLLQTSLHQQHGQGWRTDDRSYGEEQGNIPV